MNLESKALPIVAALVVLAIAGVLLYGRGLFESPSAGETNGGAAIERTAPLHPKQREARQSIRQGRFDEAFERNPEGFVGALLDARDYVGTYLADSFARLSPDGLTYAQVRDAFLEIDYENTGGDLCPLIANNFAARDIGYVRAGPRLEPPNKESHFFSPRTELPYDLPSDTGWLRYRERRHRRM